ncbi:DUF3885 domain-containing protein [Paenibacillus thiaminolyticus]|uniref:DUF3885 domain-containing protein n=1 Tax=Paenibacillus thiaminolyticus TaxID=49283 RepID=UPI00232FC482|nr:DUF3885 domain-containing protein [Paenibacillus thiaminolyticus]WCF09185.1 DUF3885 domain-containing protein [Paenibacillus thiaminolyticus]
MSALLNQFMEEHFGSMTLGPPLFYRWNYGIRFEIAIPWADHEELCNLRQIRDRSIGIFEFVFDDSDDIFFVTDIHCDASDIRLQRRPARVYPKYVKNKKRIRTLRHQVLPNLFGEDGEGQEENNEVTHRFVLLCRKSDLRYIPLLTAISHEDFRHPMQILKRFPRSGIDIYFINKTKKMIYHLYDDRGCDVICAEADPLRPLYEEFNDWILDYDREKIEALFGA